MEIKCESTSIKNMPSGCDLLENLIRCISSSTMSYLQTNSPSMASCSSVLAKDTRPPITAPITYTNHVRRPASRCEGSNNNWKLQSKVNSLNITQMISQSEKIYISNNQYIFICNHSIK